MMYSSVWLLSNDEVEYFFTKQHHAGSMKSNTNRISIDVDLLGGPMLGLRERQKAA